MGNQLFDNALDILIDTFPILVYNENIVVKLLYKLNKYILK